MAERNLPMTVAGTLNSISATFTSLVKVVIEYISKASFKVFVLL